MISSIHSAIYGVPTLVAIFLVFLTLNLKTRFIGIRKFPDAIKGLFRGKKGGRRSPISSACVSLSATVGTGNIVGVAGAVTLGGAGAVFWMWVSAILCMTVKFCEIYLSSVYKGKAGALEYIFVVFKSRAPKAAFLIFGIIASFGIGNLTQTNAAASSFSMLLNNFGITAKSSRFIIGVFFAVACLIILSRETYAAKFCEMFLPFMAAAYIILCVIVLCLSRDSLLQTFLSIIKGAFYPRSVTYGAVGSVFTTLRAGVARGLFSNEAGLSTAALAYEKSDEKPFSTALFGILEVFVDTILLCTLTALVVLNSGTAVYGEDQGAYTTLCAFMSVLGRKSVFAFCPIICFFAFSSVIGWGIYARRFAEKLGLDVTVIITVYAVCCMIGAVTRADTVWQIAEISSIFMMATSMTALIKHRKKLTYQELKP